MKNYPQLGKRYSGKPFGDIGYAAFNSGHVTNEMMPRLSVSKAFYALSAHSG
jgi:hypothetical protein